MANENNNPQVERQGVHYNTAAVRAVSREQWISDNLDTRKLLTGEDEPTATKVLGDHWDVINGAPAPEGQKTKK
ncbi:hypothetical protein UFOVP74_40 [uncultured Caudovirales phage]|uniref:Uncharacterized protein n=1 Tax=uncultured Caudovirales phage TaxID=2100421 RepID=A0A6J5KZV4_9CAUD|nr:hypothetical protein UFOVP74_40 [uncultured Caudovirales phage]